MEVAFDDGGKLRFSAFLAKFYRRDLFCQKLRRWKKRLWNEKFGTIADERQELKNVYKIVYFSL